MNRRLEGVFIVVAPDHKPNSVEANLSDRSTSVCETWKLETHNIRSTNQFHYLNPVTATLSHATGEDRRR